MTIYFDTEKQAYSNKQTLLTWGKVYLTECTDEQFEDFQQGKLIFDENDNLVENPKYEEELVKIRKQKFYKNFIATSLGNYRLEPKGYANAQQAMDVTNTMATALGGLTEQLTSLVIFYKTPDFTKEEECTEEWLVAHQIKPDVMKLEEWQNFYLEFCQLYAMQQYKADITNQDDSL